MASAKLAEFRGHWISIFACENSWGSDVRLRDLAHAGCTPHVRRRTRGAGSKILAAPCSEVLHWPVVRGSRRRIRQRRRIPFPLELASSRLTSGSASALERAMDPMMVETRIAAPQRRSVVAVVRAALLIFRRRSTQTCLITVVEVMSADGQFLKDLASCVLFCRKAISGLDSVATTCSKWRVGRR